MRGGLAVLVGAIVAAPAAASAGRTYYGWLYGTEVLPERSVELQSWLAEQNDLEADGARETRWWIGPLVGITDQLELALPVQVAWSRDAGVPRTALDRYGAELRYRFVTQDPVNAPAFAPLVRLAVNRLVTAPDTISPEADLVGSYQYGRVHALADLGVYGEISSDPKHFTYDASGTPSTSSHHFEFRPGAGVSIQAIGDLRFGAEIHAEITLEDGTGWLILGPNLAWTYGRFWLSAAYGFGIGPHRGDAPKVQWGVAF